MAVKVSSAQSKDTMTAVVVPETCDLDIAGIAFKHIVIGNHETFGHHVKAHAIQSPLAYSGRRIND